jgi:hypothetical protein
MTITHLAHIAGHQNMAKTTTATANKNRQKQSFMISSPSSLRRTNFIKIITLWQGQNMILCKIASLTRDLIP